MILKMCYFRVDNYGSCVTCFIYLEWYGRIAEQQLPSLNVVLAKRTARGCAGKLIIVAPPPPSVVHMLKIMLLCCLL